MNSTISGSKIPCDIEEFHNYSVEWADDSIKWFLDDIKYHSVCIKDSINSTPELHKPHYIILNLAIGGDWPQDPDETTQFPDTVYVDYVRVFQKQNKYNFADQALQSVNSKLQSVK